MSQYSNVRVPLQMDIDEAFSLDRDRECMTLR